MFIDTQHLLKPISELEPSGPSLEYSAEFALLERTAHGTRDQQMGSAVIAGEPPDPRAVINQSIALLERTKDLRVALYLQRAFFTLHGLPAFLEGLSLLRGLLEEFWDTVHPQLDPDDDSDCALRANTLAALSSTELLLALRSTPLFESCPLGSVSPVAAGFREQEPARLTALSEALSRARVDVAAVEATFERRAAQGPNLEALSAFLAKAEHEIDARRNDSGTGLVPPAPTEKAARGSNTGRPEIETRAPGLAHIKNRHDVIRVLNEIRAYYKQHEPSSPLPLLLERCQRLATLDFIEIVKDLSPDALPRIQIIAGTSPNDGAQ